MSAVRKNERQETAWNNRLVIELEDFRFGGFMTFGFSQSATVPVNREPSSLRSKLTVHVLCLTLLVCTLFANAQAQQSLGSAPNSEIALQKTSADDMRYRIGPGDVLTVLVRKAPELSLDSVRVDQRGMIRIPMIAGEIAAACHTENELEKEIATLYLQYKKNPSVDVFVRDFQSRPVSVIGGVNQPGRFRLRRQGRLVE